MLTGQSDVRLTVTSTAFDDGDMMPSRCTCDGEDMSPNLSWEGAPRQTSTFVLMVEDRIIPVRGRSLLTWVHWLVYNIPSTVTSLPEGLPKGEVLENGARQGMTSFRQLGYGGPCPPLGTHRYLFRVYAVDTSIDLEPGRATKKHVLKALQGHVVGYGELVGTYRRRR